MPLYSCLVAFTRLVIGFVWTYARDFIKATQICIDNFHTIGLQKSNGQTLNFVRVKSLKTPFSFENYHLCFFVLYVCYTCPSF
jgi:hypothetical protein